MRKRSAMQCLMSACAVMYLLSAGGCTAQAAYEAVRRNVRNDCYHKLPDAEVARCLARTQDSFEEYRRKREAVIRQAGPGEPE